MCACRESVTHALEPAQQHLVSPNVWGGKRQAALPFEPPPTRLLLRGRRHPCARPLLLLRGRRAVVLAPLLLRSLVLQRALNLCYQRLQPLPPQHRRHDQARAGAALCVQLLLQARRQGRAACRWPPAAVLCCLPLPLLLLLLRGLRLGGEAERGAAAEHPIVIRCSSRRQPIHLVPHLYHPFCQPFLAHAQLPKDLRMAFG